MAQTNWQDYLKMLRGLSKTLEQLAQTEREKNQAASQGDLSGVEACMKREQALSLSLRGYDQKRDAMLAGLGLAGLPLRGLEDRVPEELRLGRKPWPRSCAGSTNCFKRRARWPGTPWSAICGPSSGARPSRPETPPRPKRSARPIKPIFGRKVRSVRPADALRKQKDME